MSHLNVSFKHFSRCRGRSVLHHRSICNGKISVSEETKRTEPNGRFRLDLHVDLRDAPTMIMENRTSPAIRLIRKKDASLMENVTLVFPHSSTKRWRCEDTRSLVKCELICQNHSHVICQCPSVSSSMDYVLLPVDEDADEGHGSDPGRCQDTEHVAKVRDEQMNELINESFF